MITTSEAWEKYRKGEVLRLAARSIHRQAKKRFPDCPYPPKSALPEAMPEYEEWFNGEILPRYEGLENELTHWELKADERWINAIVNTGSYLGNIEAAKREELIQQAELGPYGHLTWGIGDGDDFVCLDWGWTGETITFLSVLNSETGSFIMRFGFEAEVPKDKAVRIAIGMVDSAYDWCFDNEVEIDHEGWNYSAWRFVEDVKQAVGNTTTVNPFPKKSE